MPDPYPIMEVPPEQAPEQEWEDMGSKPKHWFQPADAKTLWLFKYPQRNTGQHWAEKIAEEVAKKIGIDCARVELALCEGQPGSATKSFLSDGWELAHGNQLLGASIPDYDEDKKLRQSRHTLENIFGVMDIVFDAAGASSAKRKLADYFVLDALIGNTDRHHENWGALRDFEQNECVDSIGPTFDHASSLGRELRDERRRMLLRENRVGNYAEKGRGAIYWTERDRHGLSPLELVRRASKEYGDWFHPALEQLKTTNADALADLVERVPEDWMSREARDFAACLLHYNLGQLQELF